MTAVLTTVWLPGPGVHLKPTPERRIDPTGCGARPLGEEVRVDVFRRVDTRVTEGLGDGAEFLTLVEEQRRERMPEIMEADPADTGLPHPNLECAPDGPVVQGSAQGFGEDQAVSARCSPA